MPAVVLPAPIPETKAWYRVSVLYTNSDCSSYGFRVGLPVELTFDIMLFFYNGIQKFYYPLASTMECRRAMKANIANLRSDSKVQSVQRGVSSDWVVVTDAERGPQPSPVEMFVDHTDEFKIAEIHDHGPCFRFHISEVR
jgi:hypothetical protein